MEQKDNLDKIPPINLKSTQQETSNSKNNKSSLMLNRKQAKDKYMSQTNRMSSI
jgi:hypothetical protein